MTRPDPLPGQPTGAVVFEEPWQAKAFALALHLQAQGVFTGVAWAEALGRACARDGTEPWRAWTEALEDLLAERSLAEPKAVAEMAEAWHRAAEATPHGQPIQLGDAI